MKHFIIPIFIPHYGCEHACVFCNQHKITGAQTDVTAAYIERTIEENLKRVTEARLIEVAFYGGSFTALPLALQDELLAPAAASLTRGQIHAIRLSTRPDCVDETTLANLVDHGVGTIEIGVQSLDDEVLRASARGHRAIDVARAVRLIRETKLELGLQLMPGLPLDTWRSVMKTLYAAVALRPDFVRIYPTVVLKGTRLAEMYRDHAYTPLTLQEAVRYAAVMKLVFARQGIPVIRMGLQATEQLGGGAVLGGPYHPSFGELVDMYVFQVMIGQVMEEIGARGKDVIVCHAAKDASKARGNRNANAAVWYGAYGPKSISFRQAALERGRVRVVCDHQSYLLDTKWIAHI